MKKLICILIILICAGRISAQVWKKAIPDKLVILTFDDAVLSHYTNVAPLLKKYGFTATFFVCEFGGKPNFTDKTKYMTWEQIAELNKMGFEIGNHTWHHTHVNKVDDAKLKSELEYIEQKFAEYNIPKPVSFAYPAYDTSRHAMQVLKDKGYKYARAGWDRVYDPKTDNPLLMPGFTTHSEKADAAYDIFKQANNGRIAVLTIHGVPDDAHPWVTTSKEIFEGFLKFLKENHYKVIAMRDMDKYINADVAVSQLTPELK